MFLAWKKIASSLPAQAGDSQWHGRSGSPIKSGMTIPKATKNPDLIGVNQFENLVSTHCSPYNSFLTPEYFVLALVRGECTGLAGGFALPKLETSEGGWDIFLELSRLGNDLFSRSVARQLSLALKRLTSEFGKGSGRTISHKSPSQLNHKILKSVFLILSTMYFCTLYYC